VHPGLDMADEVWCRDLLDHVMYYWPEMREVDERGCTAHEGENGMGSDAKYRHVVSALGTAESPDPFSATLLTTAARSPVSVITSLEGAPQDLVSFCGDAVALLTVASQWSLGRLLETHETMTDRGHSEGGTTFERAYEHPWLRIMADAAPKAFHEAAHPKSQPESGSRLRLLCMDAHATATYMGWSRPVCFVVTVDAFSMDPICVGPPLTNLRFPVTTAMHFRVAKAAFDSARDECIFRALPVVPRPPATTAIAGTDRAIVSASALSSATLSSSVGTSTPATSSAAQ
jgi:hypothetical protein